MRHALGSRFTESDTVRFPRHASPQIHTVCKDSLTLPRCWQGRPQAPFSRRERGFLGSVSAFDRPGRREHGRHLLDRIHRWPPRIDDPDRRRRRRIHPRRPDSWLPSTDNAAVAETASTLGLDLQLELSRCQVETNSPVCHGIDELRTHLTDMRRLAAKAAELNGCRLLAVGAPLSGPSRFEISDSPRYRRMGERFGALAAEQSICGCHIHVASLIKYRPCRSAITCASGCPPCWH